MSIWLVLLQNMVPAGRKPTPNYTTNKLRNHLYTTKPAVKSRISVRCSTYIWKVARNITWNMFKMIREVLFVC